MSAPTMRRGWQADQRGPRYVPTTNGPKLVVPLARRRRTSERTAQKAWDGFRQMCDDLAAVLVEHPDCPEYRERVEDATRELRAVLCLEATDDISAHRKAYIRADADSDVLVSEWQDDPCPEKEDRVIDSVIREAKRGMEFAHALLRRRTMRVIR